MIAANTSCQRTGQMISERGVNMLNTDNGTVSYDGNVIELTTDVCILIIAVRDHICAQAPLPELKEAVQTAFEQAVIRSLAMPLGQSDKERANKASKQNP